LKIVQISDIHSGSLDDHAAVEKGIQKILNLQPDIIFFTGDLVNNSASEMEDKISLFSAIKAPMGVYSIFGNHDYGDYVQWPSAEAKKENLEKLKKVHADLGWKLLLNENIAIEKNGEQIALIGIENWGARANFSKYGNLKKAYQGAEPHPFKILLSHDPSHWEAEVCKDFTDIDLMLSGHTHGMQFGVEIPGFRWSPVQYVYRQWGGLYKKSNQHLYVNRGFGFLGYPGRVGILPEITYIELA
jgi:predicted MPP superfamily phosphohydrolase